MIVVNKKFKVIVITLLILLEAASTYLMYRSFNNKNVVLDSVQLKDASAKRSGLAIMLEQEDGTYKESTSSTWPEDMMYNDEKSGCIDDKGNAIDGALTYEGGVANIRTKSSSYCFLYFDLIKDDVTIAISTDGKSGVMPSSGAYTNDATCSSGNITWSDKYQRIEIGSLTKPIKCNVSFTKDTSTKTLLKDEVENKANTNANGYRYSGTNPDNYIWFNNEMWRIIGSIPTCLSASCGSNTTNLVKIIRNDLIGGVAYDAKVDSYLGYWGSNTLYTLLNSYYYGALNGTNTNYCKGLQGNSKLQCNYSNTGINSDGYYGKMVKNVYWNTGGSAGAVTPSTAYTNEIATRTVYGHIGLIAISDYGYAASSSYHSKTMDNFCNSTSITLSNWLFSTGYEWTNILSTTNAGQAYRINGGGCLSNDYAYNVTPFRPVAYLDSSVYIISGDGTEGNPYQIGM